MKKIFIYILLAITIASTSMMFICCGKKVPESSSVEETQGLYLEETNLTLAIGELYKLTAKDADGIVTWISNDESIVTVSPDGELTPIAEGVTTVKAKDDKNIALCRVEVVKLKTESVLYVALNKTQLLLRQGDSFSVDATAKYDGGIVDCSFEWRSEDEKVATVKDGVITAVGVGTTEITVIAKHNGKTAQEKITVVVSATEPVLIFDISNQIVCGEELELKLKLIDGDSVKDIDNSTAEFYCEDANGVITLNGDRIIANKKGVATIKATCMVGGVEYVAQKEISVRMLYNISYDVDGELFASQTVYDGDSFDCIKEQPEKAGYMFRYWQKDGKEYDFESAVNEDLVLEPCWLGNTMIVGDDYSYSTFGAYVTGGSSEIIQNATVNGAGNLFYKSSSNTTFVIYLPRVKYSDYKTVSFDFTYMGWYMLGYGGGMNFSTSDAISSNYGTISITNNGDNTYSVMMIQNAYFYSAEQKFIYSGTLTYSKDADIIDGAIGLNLDCDSMGNINRTFTLGEPKFTLTTMEDGMDYSLDTFGSVVFGGVNSTKQFATVNKNGDLVYKSNAKGGTFVVYLPRINYYAYKTVTFDYTYAGGYKLGIGEEMNSSMTDDESSNYGTISVKNNGDNTYSVVMVQHAVTANGSKTYSYKIVLTEDTDADIIYGSAGLEIACDSMGNTGREFTLSVPKFINVTLDKEESYFDNLYGACVKDTTGTVISGSVVMVNEKGELFYKSGQTGGSSIDFYIYLPRVDYSAYKTVTFSYSYMGFYQVGYIGKNYSQKDNDGGTITITNNGDGTYLVVMIQNATMGGNVNTHTYTGTLTEDNDADVIKGLTGIKLDCNSMGNSNRSFTLSVPEFVDTVLDEGWDYSFGAYGASVSSGTSGTTKNATVDTQGNLVYEIAVNSRNANLYLPRVNYSVYESVTFGFTYSGGYMLGYGGEMNYSISDDINSNYGTITIINNGDKTYTVAINQYAIGQEGPQTYYYSGTLIDEKDFDIIYGNKGLKIDCDSMGNSDKTLTLGLPKFTHETLDVGEDYSNNVFGACVKDTTGAVINGSVVMVNEKGELFYKSGQTGGSSIDFYIYLPRVDYSAYKTVTFSYSYMGFYQVGYIGMNYSQKDTDGGTITITNNGDGTYLVVMIQNATMGGTVNTHTYKGTLTEDNDADVINGIIGIKLNCNSMGNPNRSFTLSTPEFTLFTEE